MDLGLHQHLYMYDPLNSETWPCHGKSNPRHGKLWDTGQVTGVKVISSKVRVFTVPTDAPESDGTLSWTSTTLILIELRAGGKHGLGYTYADKATAVVAETLLKQVVQNEDVFSHAHIWLAMTRRIRNLGETGIAQMALSAIDNALWDLRARLLDYPLVHLLFAARSGIPVYGSGGSTSYSDWQLTEQLSSWAQDGFTMVKIKVGTHPEDDERRMEVARKAVGNSVKLFVDANGGYTLTQALKLAQAFGRLDVTWFEEPVSSDNLAGLRHIRERVPAGMDVAAGEYGYTAWYFQRTLNESAVTVLQADATRCGGVTGFLNAAALCWATNTPMSSHCGPSMHLHACCAVARAVHMEIFHDHACLERLFFDGFCEPVHGIILPDLSRPGIGLGLKERDAAKYLVT